MAAKVFFAVSLLMIAVCSEANVSARDLESERKEGEQKIRSSNEASKKEVQDIQRNINSLSNEIRMLIHPALENGTKLYESFDSMMNFMVNESVLYTIDEKENMNFFGCILKVRKETGQELRDIYEQSNVKVRQVHEGIQNEVEELQDVISFISSVVTGFYEKLIEIVKKCEMSECIKTVINRAQEKQKNLSKVIASYKGLLVRYKDDYVKRQQEHFDEARGIYRVAMIAFEKNTKHCFLK